LPEVPLSAKLGTSCWSQPVMDIVENMVQAEYVFSKLGDKLEKSTPDYDAFCFLPGIQKAYATCLSKNASTLALALSHAEENVSSIAIT